MNEHRITEGEETVVVIDRMLIGIKNVVSGGESRDKHHQSRLRKVEVRNQSIDRLELETWVDEKLCVTGALLKLIKALIDRLQSSRRSCTDRDDSSSFGFRFIKSIGRFL